MLVHRMGPLGLPPVVCHRRRAGIFFDGTDQVAPFGVIVEDSVSIGWAFGGGVASVLSRSNEPILFRRCHVWSLDWWAMLSGRIPS